MRVEVRWCGENVDRMRTLAKEPLVQSGGWTEHDCGSRKCTASAAPMDDTKAAQLPESDPVKPQLRQIEFVDKGIDH